MICSALFEKYCPGSGEMEGEGSSVGNTEYNRVLKVKESK